MSKANLFFTSFALILFPWYTALEDEVGPDGKKMRPGINPVMIDELTECNSMLSAQRKKRQVCIFGP
jgi:hypothetical protein